MYVQPHDGRPLQRVTSSPAHELIPDWSPDGTALAFQSGYNEGSIWVVRRQGKNAWGKPVQRTARGIVPNWSPDGKLIAYVAGTFEDGGSIAVVPADSGAARLLLDASRTGTPRAEVAIWGPDGRTIYFKSHDARSNASFWSVPSTGGTPRLLVRFDDPARPSYRSEWAMRGNRFYFLIQDRQSDVWVMDAESP